jgi:hypothetical protein
MVTQFHTLSHNTTLFCTLFQSLAGVAASIRKVGVSKSHLLYSLSHYAYKMRTAYAAGPLYNTLFMGFKAQ